MVPGKGSSETTFGLSGPVCARQKADWGMGVRRAAEPFKVSASAPTAQSGLEAARYALLDHLLAEPARWPNGVRCRAAADTSRRYSPSRREWGFSTFSPLPKLRLWVGCARNPPRKAAERGERTVLVRMTFTQIDTASAEAARTLYNSEEVPGVLDRQKGHRASTTF